MVVARVQILFFFLFDPATALNERRKKVKTGTSKPTEIEPDSKCVLAAGRNVKYSE